MGEYTQYSIYSFSLPGIFRAFGKSKREGVMNDQVSDPRLLAKHLFLDRAESHGKGGLMRRRQEHQ